MKQISMLLVDTSEYNADAAQILPTTLHLESGILEQP